MGIYPMAADWPMTPFIEVCEPLVLPTALRVVLHIVYNCRDAQHYQWLSEVIETKLENARLAMEAGLELQAHILPPSQN